MADLGKLDLKKSLGVYSKNMIIDLRWFSGGNGCYLEFRLLSMLSELEINLLLSCLLS